MSNKYTYTYRPTIYYAIKDIGDWTAVYIWVICSRVNAHRYIQYTICIYTYPR